jgi:hypothetical protein
MSKECVNWLDKAGFAWDANELCGPKQLNLDNATKKENV